MISGCLGTCSDTAVFSHMLCEILSPGLGWLQIMIVVCLMLVCTHNLCCENWDLNNLFPNYVEMFYCSGYSQYFSFKFFFVVEFFRCTSVKVLRLEHLSPLWGSLLKIKSVGVRIEVYTDLHRGHPCLSQKKRPMSHPSFFLHLDGRTKALCRVRTQVQRMQRDIRTSF